MTSRTLISIEDSIVVVIDVQDHFLNKLPDENRNSLINRICWLITIAKLLKIPVLMTVEDASRIGGLPSEIEAVLWEGLRIYNKLVFSVAGESEIMAAIKETGRTTVLLAGLEADVCVSQSALELMQAGYRVAVVADAVSSPGAGYEFGIERSRQAGADIVSLKMVYYEWMRTVEKERRFWNTFGSELGLPDGLEL